MRRQQPTDPQSQIEVLQQQINDLDHGVRMLRGVGASTLQTIDPDNYLDPTQGEVANPHTDVSALPEKQLVVHHEEEWFRVGGSATIATWRGLMTEDLVISAGSEETIVWDTVENTNTDIFSATGPTSAVNIFLPGTWAISAWFNHSNWPDDPAFCWIAVQDLWDSADATYHTKSGWPQLGDQIGKEFTRTYPPQGETVAAIGSPIARIQVDAGNGDSSARTIPGFGARLEIALVAPLHPSIVWHD